MGGSVEPTSKLFQVIDWVLFFVLVGQRLSFPCWWSVKVQQYSLLRVPWASLWSLHVGSYLSEPVTSNHASHQVLCMLQEALSFLSALSLTPATESTLLFFFFFLFRGIPVAYGSSQARGWIRAVASGVHHSLSNTRFKLHLWPMPQLWQSQIPGKGQEFNLYPHGY